MPDTKPFVSIFILMEYDVDRGSVALSLLLEALVQRLPQPPLKRGSREFRRNVSPRRMKTRKLDLELGLAERNRRRLGEPAY
jgi:hypothetical protein